MLHISTLKLRKVNDFVCAFSFSRQFAKSLISQAHLCPLPLHVSPIYWAYDNGLRLYPLPDVIVTADKFDPFTTTAVSATVVNPVSFSFNKRHFHQL